MIVPTEAYFVVILVSILVSALTLFSGFGLGTLLLPAFAVFFPISVAVAATAVVHLANNLFKLALLWRHIAWNIAVRFAVPAAVSAAVGAYLLTRLDEMSPLVSYTLGSRICEVTVTKLVISLLITAFALLELTPKLGKRLSFRPEHLIIGAMLSGFFGGLSGHQGALRSAVLLRFGFPKHTFIATGVACAVTVDIARLITYGSAFYSANLEQLTSAGGVQLVAAATLAAFLGAFIGARLIQKVTMHAIQKIVGVMLILLALGLATGVL